MKKFTIITIICLAAFTGFSQEKKPGEYTAVQAQPSTNTPGTDSVSTDKKFIAEAPGKRKSKSAKRKKECSRMKS